MLKNKTQRIKRISSAALIGLAIYGSSVSQVSANSLRFINGGRQNVRIERMINGEKEGSIIERGVVTSVEKDKLVVIRESDKLSLSVLVSDQTKIWKGFQERGGLVDIVVGDKVGVWGKENTVGEGIVQASVVRDFSKHNKKGTFKGTVVKIVGEMVSVRVKNKELTVSGVKLFDRENVPIKASDIGVGDKLRVGISFGGGKQEILFLQDLNLPKL